MYRNKFFYESIRPVEGLTDVYEFGVFSGASMQDIGIYITELGFKVQNFIGFDSFQGIPKETAEPCYDPVWDPDISTYYKAFNSQEYFKTPSVAATMARLDESIKPHVPPGANYKLVPGFYADSLTDTLPQEIGLNKAWYVGIDVDIYSSALTVLDWLFRNELIQVGTYVAYDDWGGTPGYKEFKDGESRAHREISEKYKVEWEFLNSNDDLVPDAQVLFQVKSIGS